ncbi:probable ribonuclease P/MRP protein subunit POP5 isoform X2 [Humulus lupulus]|uniref:probable ribonuclease P/MRP protein subunit POP5 isoform X2 n=1 Tax=Humulus lupulus TaxID=3486 RepID=UPI002B401636|nr:probable ribonuclease P/MRP protein subunit POP5 isoform X2 [Humulus lupulus]
MVGFKNRYMVVEVNLNPNRDLGTDDPIIITPYNVTKAIKDNILINFGECGLASSVGSLQVKYVNHITKICIIRASREEYQKVWSAITMVRSIGNVPVVINLLDLTALQGIDSPQSFKSSRHASWFCFREMRGIDFSWGLT